ncbi:hypothetical protein KBD49_06445 [Myxococcota bacterium]|nr:hypothetical protein [Myxococcota bacterium]
MGSIRRIAVSMMVLATTGIGCGGGGGPGDPGPGAGDVPPEATPDLSSPNDVPEVSPADLPPGPDVPADPSAEPASDVPVAPDPGGQDTPQEPCPQDFHGADGTPCPEEDRVCGGPCTDRCQFCSVLRCEGGFWTWIEVFPDPNCGDAAPGEDGTADAAEPGTPSYRISGCGGFGAPDGGRSAAGYCDAEVLSWLWDPVTGSLVIQDRRVLLNCCGDRSMRARWSGDTLVLEETDAPPQEGRCRCLCVFDFEATVPGVQAATVPVRLVREVTDSGEGPRVLWEAMLDAGSPGAVVLDPVPVGYGCVE